MVAQELANAAAVESGREDNMSVRELFDKMLGGKLVGCLRLRIIMPRLLIAFFASGSESGQMLLRVW